MVTREQRRFDALSAGRIVEAATEILDTEGEGGLTFRSLAARLSTGPGAIYHHVANKGELLAATTDDVVSSVMQAVAELEASGAGATASPEQRVRAIALGLFDAIDAHPWVGAQLGRAPWQSAMVQIFESIGSAIEQLGVPERGLFDAASAVLYYVIGVAGQNAANAREMAGRVDRATFLADAAGRWSALDRDHYPFLHQVAPQLADHDDREQFAAGIDLILAGITAGHDQRHPAR